MVKTATTIVAIAKKFSVKKELEAEEREIVDRFSSLASLKKARRKDVTLFYDSLMDYFAIRGVYDDSDLIHEIVATLTQEIFDVFHFWLDNIFGLIQSER